jgi:hypothetical protein
MTRIKNFNQHLNLNEGTGDSNYLQNMKVVVKGDKESAEAARKMVGDGKEPNKFFVTANNDYMFFDENNEMKAYSDSPKEAPVKVEDHIEVETFGPFDDFKDAMKKADELDLSETTGPRYVMIEDRKTGQIYEKYLKAEKKIVWSDETNDDTKRYGYQK